MNRVFPAYPVLIVDDEEDALATYEMSCKYDGINNLILCKDSREVKQILASRQISLAILDLMMPHVTGHELLKHISETYPSIPVLIITAMNTIDEAVSCMREGAFDYMVKPIERTKFSHAINRALEVLELKHEVSVLSKNLITHELQNPGAFSGIVTNNAQMKSIFKYLESIANSNRSILITGESGVGKELIARAIYQLSGSTGKFVALNIAGLDETLFSDTIVGHDKGAFSGADTVRQGLLQMAENGFLFMDEIGDLGAMPQVKLLRLLQEREFYPLGSDASQVLNARIIAATNANLPQLINTKGFRKDLYYRLSTHHIAIPPLRDRLDDLPLLFRHFAREASTSMGKEVPQIPRGLFTILERYHFPGNVRELQSMVIDATARCEADVYSQGFFEAYINRQSTSISAQLRDENHFPTLREAERILLVRALQKTNYNQSQAAKLLGISQSTISRKLLELNNEQSEGEKS